MCQSAVSAFLRCRFVRELGAAKRAVPPGGPNQAAWSGAGMHRLRGWKTALPGIPALWVRDAPDLWSGHPCAFRWSAAPCRRTAGLKHGSAA